MPNVAVFDVTGKEVGKIDLSDAVFGIEPNAVVMHEVVVNYLANQRQGTQSALTRSEVSGGGKSPGDKKAPAMRDRVPPVLPSGLMAVSYLLPSREATVIP